MNHLNAIEKVNEILGDYTDDSGISFWERRVRRAEEPEKVIQNLKKAVKTANEFWDWVESHSEFYTRNLSWEKNAIYSKLLFWGFIPGKLKDAKEDFSSSFEEEKERQEALFNGWVKEKRELEARTFYN